MEGTSDGQFHDHRANTTAGTLNDGEFGIIAAGASLNTFATAVSIAHATSASFFAADRDGQHRLVDNLPVRHDLVGDDR